MEIKKNRKEQLGDDKRYWHEDTNHLETQAMLLWHKKSWWWYKTLNIIHEISFFTPHEACWVQFPNMAETRSMGFKQCE